MSRYDLSILCVTRAEPHAFPLLEEMCGLANELGAEFVVVPDGPMAAGRLHDRGYRPARYVTSEGYIESVLDQALALCSGDYVLRLDDDERCSSAMVEWLVARKYQTAIHWKFCRANLWERTHERTITKPDLVVGEITQECWLMHTPQLWPDRQTRLSLKGLAGDRKGIHSGSPHGGGEEAPCMILHEKFLVKSADERRSIVRRYDMIQPGAGANWLPWSVPEDFYERVQLAPVGNGTVREWADDELKSVSLRTLREVAA